MDYLAQAIPVDHVARQKTLTVTRQLMADHWDEVTEKSLFYHPRQLAFELFEASLNFDHACKDYTVAEKHEIMQSILGIDLKEV